MSDPRRRARQKQNPLYGQPAENNPHRVSRQTIVHPVYGKVKLWFKGVEIYRISAEQHIIPGYEFTYYGRHWYPEKFRQVLDMLGISE